MKFHNNIIAIGGLKNSGKDTAANMLQYLLNSPRIFHTYSFYKAFNKIFNRGKYKITSFAFPLKKTLAALLNLPVEVFNDRNFKENFYIFFPTLEIRSKLPDGAVTISDSKFNRLLSNNDISFVSTTWISIRQLLQLFGTECMRKTFGDNLWILATVRNTKNIIISDLRFNVEYEFLKEHKSIIIYIKRDTCTPGSHASEKEIVKLYENNSFDYVVENNTTLKDLFNNIKSTLNKI